MSERAGEAALKRGNLLPSNKKSYKQGGHSNTSQSGGAKQSDICSMYLSQGKSYYHSLTACWHKEAFIQKMSDPSQQDRLLKCLAHWSKSLVDLQRGAEGDRKVDAQHDAQSPSTEKQHLVPQAPQSHPDPRSNELLRYPVGLCRQ